MDPVRFGRALGAGARAAAKTVVHAADAAAAPNPRPARAESPVRGAGETIAPRETTEPASAGAARGTGSAGAAVAASARPAGAQVRAAQASRTARGVREGARRFGREVWRPVVRLSGVLWLEFAGVFFGIFALFALGAALRLRGAWHTTGANGVEHQRLLGAIAMLAVFGYFCVSSFVRAARRSRRR